ncbi:MAG TPA: class I SAM-dependent methyltransferase [Streptosporangiaceae bacterium]
MDEQGVVDFLMKLAGDAAAAAGGLSVAIGDRLGLYPAMAGAGPLTAAGLAERTGLVERYLEEWLAVQAGLGYVEYDPDTRTFTLPDEHAAVLADEDSPAFLAGVFPVLRSLYATEDGLINAFRVGGGVGWDEHSDPLYRGTARLFRPGYRQNIVDSWLPALDGMVDRLRAGARVADVGCGFGYSTIIMAVAFPKSTFVGIDYHAPSLDAAAKAASEADVTDRVSFEVAGGANFRGTGFDLITCFDCLHDMGDPQAVARRVLEALADDGTWMLVEPAASGRLEENFNPIGRFFLAASLAVCLPSAMAQHGPMALGNHAGEDALRAAVQSAGFGRWRRAAETPVNVVYEVRQ